MEPCRGTGAELCEAIRRLAKDQRDGPRSYAAQVIATFSFILIGGRGLSP